MADQKAKSKTLGKGFSSLPLPKAAAPAAAQVPPDVKQELADKFIAGAINSQASAKQEIDLPWEHLDKADQRPLPVFNLRMTPEYKLKLKFIADNRRRVSQHAFVVDHIEPIIDAEVKRILKNMSKE